MKEEQKTSEISAAIEAGKEIASRDLLYVASVPAAHVSKGYDLHLFPELLDTPLRTQACFSAEDDEGFCEYVKKYATPDTAVFYGIAKALFLAIIDYHSTDEPGWCEHTVRLELSESQQWRDWSQMPRAGDITQPPLAPRAATGQEDFANFIENHAEDITQPPLAELLEAVLNFHEQTNVTFSSVKRVQNGRVQIFYSEDGETNALALPAKIMIGIPVLEGGPRYGIEALLRYRVRERKLYLWFEITQQSKIIRTAISALISEIRSKIPSDVPMYAGTPSRSF